MKMEQTECSETSTYKIQTPGNYPEESIKYSEHGESLRWRIHAISLPHWKGETTEAKTTEMRSRPGNLFSVHFLLFFSAWLVRQYSLFCHVFLLTVCVQLWFISYMLHSVFIIASFQTPSGYILTLGRENNFALIKKN